MRSLKQVTNNNTVHIFLDFESSDDLECNACWIINWFLQDVDVYGECIVYYESIEPFALLLILSIMLPLVIFHKDEDDLHV